MRSSLAYLSLVYLLLGLSAAAPTEEAAAPLKPVTKEFFQRVVHYAKLTAGSGAKSCPNPPGQVVAMGYINKITNDTSTQARIWRDDKAKEIILSFPGTTGGIDEGTDADAGLTPYHAPGVTNCPGCQTHHGFLHAWDTVAVQAHNLVQKAVQAHHGYKVVVTGHSLGAALACLAYSSFHGQGLPVKATYTYGQPRVGNPAFANHIDKLSGANANNPGNFHRITHASDSVTQLPGQDAHYRHPLTEYWIKSEGQQSAKNTFRCHGQESPACVDGHQVGGDQGITDHLDYCNLDFTKPGEQCH